MREIWNAIRASARRQWRNLAVRASDRWREAKLWRRRRAGTANEVTLVVDNLTIRRK